MGQPNSLRTVTLALVLALLALHIGRGAASGQTATPPSCGYPRSPGELAITGYINTQTGTVSIPELNLTAAITFGAADATHQGCFEFRNLARPQGPMLISFKVTADGFRPTTWMHDIVWGGDGPILTFTLNEGTAPEIFDPCPDLIAHPPTYSAAIEEQAKLCAELPGAGLPNTGSGYRAATAGSAWPMLLLALGGMASFAAGTTFWLRRR